MATNSAYQQLQQALETATSAAKSLGGDLSASSRTALRDLEKRISELRKEIEKNGRSWLSELEDRVPGRSRPAARKPAARKPAAKKTTTARKPAAKKTTAARKTTTTRSTAAKKKPAARRTTAAKKK